MQATAAAQPAYLHASWSHPSLHCRLPPSKKEIVAPAVVPLPTQVEFIGNDAGPGYGGVYICEHYSGPCRVEVVGPELTIFRGNSAVRGGVLADIDAIINGPMCAQENVATDQTQGGGFAYLNSGTTGGRALFAGLGTVCLNP